jgi:hypothetical protein
MRVREESIPEASRFLFRNVLFFSLSVCQPFFVVVNDSNSIAKEVLLQYSPVLTESTTQNQQVTGEVQEKQVLYSPLSYHKSLMRSYEEKETQSLTKSLFFLKR